MKLFLTYASEDRAVADELAVRLRTEGHTVFLDRDDLPEAEGYDARIREAIADCELYVFLISPASTQAGRYTLTELKFAREQFANPRGRVLPVTIKPTSFADIPAYLKAVTVLQPEGNLVAETVAAIGRMAATRQRMRLVRVGAVAGLVVALLAGLGTWMLSLPAPACKMLVEAAGPADSTGLALDVTTPAGTQSYRLEGAPLALELAGLPKKGGRWSLLLRGRDGGALGEQPVQGCPASRTPLDFGGGYALVLVPR
jgi:hypothetical protein